MKRNWGVTMVRNLQDKYFLSLHSTIELLAQQPKLGRKFHYFRRHEHESHIIFYTEKPYGILVVDILHEQENIHLHKVSDLP